MKKIIIAVVIIALVGVGAYFLMRSPNNVDQNQGAVNIQPLVNNEPVAPVKDLTKTVIGTSVEGRDIVAYHYGQGDTELLFIGGIHGGYEWNTALVAYNLMDYLKGNPAVIPSNVKITVIPVLNPDGLSKVVSTTTVRFAEADVSPSQSKQVAGRFNANNVDLNRNFDCDWQAKGVWQSKTVSGGSKAFSEPESQAIQNYVNTNKVTAVVVWYSSAGGVFASNCHNGVLPETTKIADVYAKGSLYPAHDSFDFYAITGDMVNWLAKNNIPAISVLLTNHTDIEWTKNLAGIDSLLKYYAK